jgi:hypothetical protein
MQRYWVAVLSALFLTYAAAVGLAQTNSTESPAPGTRAAPDLRSTPSAADADDDEENADIPPVVRGRVNEKEYLQLRDQQAAMKRGAEDLARNPRARSQAIHRMEAQEQTLHRLRTAAARSGLPALAPPGPAWTALGPDPIPNGQTVGSEVAVSGRVTAIAIDPTVSTGNTVYVGTAQGGLYRTLDGGNTWTAMMDSAQSLAIGALTLDPTDHTVLFVGTGEGNSSIDSFFGVGLYVITNANSSFVLNGPFTAPTTFPNPNADGFKDVFTGRSITRILVNPANHSQILVSTSSGFSGLGGDTFSTLPTRGAYLSTNVFSSGSTVGNPTFARLTIQTGAGTANRPITDMVMDPGNPNLVLVNVLGQSGAEGGIWASPSTVWAGTGAWTQTMQTALGVNGKFAANRSGSPTATTTFLAGLDQKPSSGMCTAEGMLFKAANNGGSSWTEVTAARGFCGGQCFYDMPVAVDPSTPNNIYLGGQAGSNIGSCGAGTLGKSTNGGTSFNSSQSLLHPDTHVIAIHPGNPSILYTGNDGGIFRSNNGGTTWASLNTAGFSATQFESIAVHPTDPNFTIGGTQDNGTPLLKPDGVTWNRADSGDGGFSAIDQNATNTTSVTMYHTYFNQPNKLIGYAISGAGANAVENNWSFSGCQGTTSANGINCADSVLFYAPLVLGSGNPNTVYFGTDRLYRSSDQGNTNIVVSQAPIVANAPISAIGVSLLTDQVRIVGLGNDAGTGVPNGHVFATTTGSSTLTDVAGPWASKYISRAVIDPNNPNTAYVTLDGYGATTGHIWKTTDLSDPVPAWTSVSSGVPDIPVNGFVVDPLNSNNLYAGTDIGVYNSIDGGSSWNPYGSGLPRVAVFDLKVTAKRTVRIATHGRGMWEISAVSPGFAASTVLSSSSPNLNLGTNLTLTARITAVSPGMTPTGLVAFVDLNGGPLGTAMLDTTGTATLSTSSLSAGNHFLVASYGGDGLYAANKSLNILVTVAALDFAVTIPSNSVTVHAGQPAVYTMNVSAANGFARAVNFSCSSGLPALATCLFNPMTLTGAGSTTLTITTAASTATPPASGLSAYWRATSGIFGLPAAAVLLVGGLAAGKQRRSSFTLVALLALTAGITSCGGGGGSSNATQSPGTPAGTSTVTITATSGGKNHTATVTLVVQ